jgi:hypothetical protein
MAKITKLSVDQVLDKLRNADEPKSKMMRWREQPFATIAGACVGMETLAPRGTTTETTPNRAGEEDGAVQAAIFDVPGKFLQTAKIT